MRSVFYRKSLGWLIVQALVFNQCAFALEQTRNIEVKSACLAPALTIQTEIINALKDPGAVQQSLKNVTGRASIQSVVFGGTLEQWENYVNKTWKQRYSSQGHLRIVVDQEKEEIIINPFGNDIYSKDLGKALNQGIKLFQNKLKNIHFAQELFRIEVIKNMANKAMAINLRLSDILPTEASREIFLDDNLYIQNINIVLKRSMVERVLKEYNSRDVSDQDKELGILWPLIRAVVHELGNKNLPRDRFIEAIDRSYYMAIWERNILFKEKKSPDRLVPNKIGKCYLDYIAQEYGIEQEMVMDIAYFRMLSEIATFITDQALQKDRRMNGRMGDNNINFAKIYIREYLDGKYLRPSLALIIPEPSESYKPMNLVWKNKKPITPDPEVGKYGIEDKEDLYAWQKVSKSFAQKGLILLAQLGIGGFGRVYLARNIDYNKAWPRDLAIKVDRIYRIMQKSSIKTQEDIMALSRDLSNSPHVIRIRDSGILDDKYTYHILQLVDGMNLDDLLGIAGRDSPGAAKLPKPKNLIEKVANMFMPAQDWATRAKYRTNTIIKQHLSLRQTLDIVISILLKVEKIHKLGYSLSDLKTGNVMISRSGWLKGIDLDDYKKIPDDPRFLMQDFFLLSKTIFFVYCYATGNQVISKKEFIAMAQGWPEEIRQKMLEAIEKDKGEYIKAENIFNILYYYFPEAKDVGELGADELKLRLMFKTGWKFSDLPVEKADAFINMFTRLMFNSRYNDYGRDPEAFSADIDKLIYLKRLFFEREMILTMPNTVSDNEVREMSETGIKPMENLSRMARLTSLGNIMLVEQAI